MMFKTSLLGVGLCLLLAGVAMAGTPGGATIEGQYLEVRSCDVFTAACFANSEVGLEGEEAILAWNVRKGTHQGVDLSGLKVVAVLRASDTLGDITESVYPARSIVFVDESADTAQREALVSLAKDEAGRLLSDVIRVEAAPIAMAMDASRPGFATMTAGETVRVETRALNHHDMHCGNDEAYYQPLTKVDNRVVAFTEHDKFAGEGLGVRWDGSGRRSAWLATFAR